MSKAYSSNLTQAQWQLVEPLIPPAKPGGRPRQVDIWEVLNAIFASLVPRLHLAQPARGFSQLANGLHLFSQLAL